MNPDLFVSGGGWRVTPTLDAEKAKRITELEARRWRVGRKVGRTVYRMVGDEPSDSDLLIGVMDSQRDATAAVEARNALPGLLDRIEALEAEVERLEGEVQEQAAIASEYHAALQEREDGP